MGNVVQHVDLGAASALATGLNGSRLDNDRKPADRVAATSRNTATATIVQSAIQLQDADGISQSQESLQLAQVGQIGTALAETTRAGSSTSRDGARGAAGRRRRWRGRDGLDRGRHHWIVIITGSGATEIGVDGVPTPSVLPTQPALVNLPSPHRGRAELRPAGEGSFSQSLASTPCPGDEGRPRPGAHPRLPGSAPGITGPPPHPRAPEARRSPRSRRFRYPTAEARAAAVLAAGRRPTAALLPRDPASFRLCQRVGAPERPRQESRQQFEGRKGSASEVPDHRRCCARLPGQRWEAATSLA